MPVVEAWRTASTEGVSLSLAQHFVDLSLDVDRSPETVTYAQPDGQELRLDVWPRPGGGDSTHSPQGRPAAVVVHGGGWGTGSRSKTPRWDVWLADQG